MTVLARRKRKSRRAKANSCLLPVSDMAPPVKKKGKRLINDDRKQKKADTDLLNSQTMDDDPSVTPGPPRDPYMCYRCEGKGKHCPLCRNVGTKGAAPGIKYGIMGGGVDGGMGGDGADD